MPQAQHHPARGREGHTPNPISLTDYKRHIYRRYLHGAHLEALDQLLTQVSLYVETGGREGVGRAIIEMPPRHGKTLTVSRLYPTWHIARNPNHRIILVSYGATLAEKNSRFARNLISSPRYVELYPEIRLSRDSKAADAWDLEGFEGGVDAMGIGGAVTGKGAHILIIDDPIKNREEAESETYREKVWDSFSDDLYTRLEPGGAVIIMMTRWHVDDLIGRVLESDPLKWHRLNLPAINDAGEALWSDRFPIEALRDIEKTLGSYSFNALYQQSPTLRDGNMFKREWFPIVDAVPVGVKRVRYWDKGGTDDGGTFTAGVLIALHPNGTIYVEDVVRGQWSAGKREAVMKQTATLDKPRLRDGEHYSIYIEQEPGSGGKESAQASIVNLQGFAVYRDLPSGDKDTRLEPFAAQAEAGNVRLVRGDWNRAYIEEMIAIPNGKYRDQGDATAGAFNRLAGRRAISVETSRWA